MWTFFISHRNICVRRTTAHYLSILVERMGPNKILMGPRDIAEFLLPAAARFVQDGSPHTRYYGRKIFNKLLNHALFDKLLRKFLNPGTFRNIVGILESIKRRVSRMHLTPNLRLTQINKLRNCCRELEIDRQTFRWPKRRCTWMEKSVIAMQSVKGELRGLLGLFKTRLVNYY